MFSRKYTTTVAVTTAALVLGGGAIGLVNAATKSSASSNGAPTAPMSASNARSGPAAGGTIGTVSSVSAATFTVSTSAGQTATVNETRVTKYEKGTHPASARAVQAGARVVVLGTTNGTTIAATKVIVQPNTGEAATSSAVVPFSRGAHPASKHVGHIPTSYRQGSGTIVSGITANKATVAALTAYPGGIVDRVVRLSNGEFEVHYIGVGWPHHIFVSAQFRVLGAD
jgi:Domain of unknown function (DUF5666)